MRALIDVGDLDGDDQQDFPPARDLHVGIVSSDLAALGSNDVYKCEGPGDDGQLQHTSSSDPDCHASYPPFISYLAGASDAATVARDLGCLAVLGTEGCGMERLSSSRC